MDSFDLVTIGSGPAGEKGAAQAAYFGHKVAVVDRQARPGGAPVNSGGIPTKTLREAATYLTSFGKRDIYGVGIGLSPGLMVERLRARAAEVQETMGAAVSENLERHHIEYVVGEATLRDGGVAVTLPSGEERKLSARVILISTGSRPFRPAGIPFDDPDVHDSDSILEMDRIPKSMVVIGAGPVGAEYASIFTALGTNVTIIDLGERMAPFLDVEVSELLRKYLEEAGTRVVLGTTGEVSRQGDRLQVELGDGEVLNPEVVLFAAGRVGNTDELAVREAGVECDERGRILVDDEYRTTVDGIYAAGDVIGPPALASVSSEQGRVAICHAFGIPFKEAIDPTPPFGVYTIPEVGMVGMTEEAAKAAGVDYEVGRSWFADNSRSAIAGSPAGLIKLVLNRDDRRLIGAHIIGEEAAELIHQAQAVIHTRGTIDYFIDSTYNVPTRSEAFKYAAYNALQRLAGSG
ncbi:MAG TPA: Si-specific NAD(P)(+) transhydrogenase [Acidimicrobiia bacterium]|nr:Si-specific NAD(P)(+) transhydrogenase [Acidimicrobiia bacterium]